MMARTSEYLSLFVLHFGRLYLFVLLNSLVITTRGMTVGFFLKFADICLVLDTLIPKTEDLHHYRIMIRVISAQERHYDKMINK